MAVASIARLDSHAAWFRDQLRARGIMVTGGSPFDRLLNAVVAMATSYRSGEPPKLRTSGAQQSVASEHACPWARHAPPARSVEHASGSPAKTTASEARILPSSPGDRAEVRAREKDTPREIFSSIARPSTGTGYRRRDWTHRAGLPSIDGVLLASDARMQSVRDAAVDPLALEARVLAPPDRDTNGTKDRRKCGFARNRDLATVSEAAPGSTPAWHVETSPRASAALASPP